MADVTPFVATRFSAQDCESLSKLLTPPYDVIDARMQQELYDRNPHNIVRVDFGKDQPGDGEFDNRYTRAGALWQEWKSAGVIVEEPKKTFYIYEEEYEVPGLGRLRRRGFFGAVRLQDYSEGGIRAHEQTFDGPKADRFRLMRATNSNLSPIFCLYDDPSREVDKLLEEGIAGREPVQAVIDGVTHRLWTVDKANVIQGITKAMAPQTLFIADGHHRYETSLLYRDELRQALRRKNGRQPFDYAMIYMNNIHDEGLVILPTHRIMSKECCHGIDAEEAVQDFAEAFDVEPLTIDSKDLAGEAQRLTELLAEAGKQGPAFVMLMQKGKGCLLRMKPDANLDELIDEEIPHEIKELDVTILHRYVINRAWLGNPEIELDDQDVRYEKDAEQTLRAMSSCKYGVAFLVNPTKIEQVCRIARLGMRMPHKSTYFYPKLITGLVMRDLNSPW